MQPVRAAMTEVRRVFISALIRSLRSTKSLLQAIFKFWILPSRVARAVNSQARNGVSEVKRDVDEFLEEVGREFGKGCDRDSLIRLSNGMREQFRESLLESPFCMLPSYNHLLPTGDERGTYLALDVGGSTFRVALIKLLGRQTKGAESRILKINSFKINSSVKELDGTLFFDWMAARIQETLSGSSEGYANSPLSGGLAWSFPIEQTSLQSGRLQSMGKGFKAANGLLGMDLSSLIEEACSRKGLSIQLKAIVNDSSATLLSKAYLDPTTRLALILGTGVNAAVHLPVHVLSPGKFGTRPQDWHDSAKHVIVNTELSMFGTGYLPLTRWDQQLLSTHLNPTFQPFEHMVSGCYLGEIGRLVLIEGILTAGLFNGVIPPSLKEPYSLDTEAISRLEGDHSPTLSSASQFLLTHHPFTPPPSLTDFHTLRTLASYISRRASALVAASVHALWLLRTESEGILPCDAERMLVAYNGSVIEHYPGFRTRCQEVLDELVVGSGGVRGGVELVYAEESSLLGAAVGVGCGSG